MSSLVIDINLKIVTNKKLTQDPGNDHDQDSDKEPEPPVKTVDKPVARAGKRDAPKEAPGAAAATTTGGPRRDAGQRTGGFNAENRRENYASYETRK